MPDTPPPGRARLARLSADLWGCLLPHARAALRELGDDPDRPERTRLRDEPTGRLAGGRGREALAALLGEDDELWRAVRERLPADLLAALVDEADDTSHEEELSHRSEGPDVIELRRRAERDRARLRDVRAERDEARRRAVGAESRADRLAEELRSARERLTALEAQVAELSDGLDRAAAERERAVARERRRREGELADLRRERTTLRRAEEERRARPREDAARRADPAPARARREPPPEEPSRLVPGRPSRLPSEVAPGTREAAELYLHRGRRVVVDGYNVTRQHQPNLDLEQQRAWLVRSLANLARVRGVVPTVIFDGEVAGAGPSRGAGREVTVRFTASGITADDEIVLEVEATDDPIVVVTDDRELADRVRVSGADVLSTRELVWLL